MLGSMNTNPSQSDMDSPLRGLGQHQHLSFPAGNLAQLVPDLTEEVLSSLTTASPTAPPPLAQVLL